MLMSELLNINPAPVPIASSSSLFVLPECYVGLEIEIENHSSVNLTDWNRVSEGSINGYELVLKEPMCGDDLFCAIQQLTEVKDTEEHFSPRTSVHVHIDIRDMDFTQLVNYLTLAVMFEPVLYKYVAPHRTHNHFCWQIGECQGIITRILDVIAAKREGKRNLRSILQSLWNPDVAKYAGINLSSVSRYGSLEFRMHEGTSNPVNIMRWINILQKLKQYAMRPNLNPWDILETKQNQGIESIFRNVLGNYSDILEYEDVHVDILKGVRVAQDFVHEMQEPVDIKVPEGPHGSLYRVFNTPPEDVLKDLRQAYVEPPSSLFQEGPF